MVGKKGKCYNPDPVKNLGQYAITGGPGVPNRKRTMADDVKKGAWRALKKRGLEAAFLQALDEASGQVVGLLKSVVEGELRENQQDQDQMPNHEAAAIIAELKEGNKRRESEVIRAQRKRIKQLEKRVAELEKGAVVTPKPRDPAATKEQTEPAQGSEFMDTDGVRCFMAGKTKYRIA